MLFNSVDFALFLPLAFALFWLSNRRSVSLSNLIIVACSYFFYGWWEWKFLSLIAFSSLLDYTIGLGLDRTDSVRNRKLLLITSLTANLGLLGLFKYYNFFVENFISAFTFLGFEPSISTFQFILPVGISFYTFQTLSYTIDVYNRKLKATNDILAFFAFVSFFPQLVAGPIERASNLLPQFFSRRQFSYNHAVNGLRQVLWGLFKKIVIADNCATFANYAFNHTEIQSGSALLLGAVLFAFQIYGDFSGYSDIAIGTSRLFGFNLRQNFAFPYFSRDIAEFWRRWHISLSTWFRDYLYIPLGGNRKGKWKAVRNTFIIFVVSGFWHGANWTFVVWGALNALYFLPLLLLSKNRNNLDTVAAGKLVPTSLEMLQMLGTFLLTVLAWVFFRANNLDHAFSYLSSIFSESLLHGPYFTDPDSQSLTFPSTLMVLLTVMLFIEWYGREQQFALEKLGLGWNKVSRWLMYYGIILSICWFAGKQQEFIYFQF